MDDKCKLVKWCIQKYKSLCTSLDEEDLFQVGYIGLLQAEQKYNPDKGDFVPYARKYVCGYVINYINNYDSAIRVPIWLQSLQYAYKKACTKDENLTVKDFLNLKRANRNSCVLQAAIDSGNMSSLNVKADKDDDELIDVIANGTVEENRIDHEILLQTIFDHANLKERTKEMIILYYGLEYTLKEIGLIFHISAEAVRLNIKKGLQTLQNVDIVQEVAL